MQTQADTHKDAAKQHVQEAIKHLSAILVDQVPGHDEFRSDYLTSMKEWQHTLLRIRDEM
jgi:hypothetical protein